MAYLHNPRTNAASESSQKQTPFSCVDEFKTGNWWKLLCLVILGMKDLRWRLCHRLSLTSGTDEMEVAWIPLIKASRSGMTMPLRHANRIKVESSLGHDEKQ